MGFAPPQLHPSAPTLPDAHTMRALRLVVWLVLAVCGGLWLFHGGATAPFTAKFDIIDLGGLPEIRSRNGVLNATLVAAPMQVHIGQASFPGAGFNGVYGGPVLRAQPGDEVRIHLVNHMADAINLHFHGLRVTPLGHGDNMQIQVRPGQVFDYAFRIPPNHPPGLFWYHDHALHHAEPHVLAGLSGAFLVEGFARRIGGLADVAQTLLVLKDWQQNDCTAPYLKQNLHCRVVSINGAADWRDTLRPGMKQLWRVSNQGANLVLHLAAPGLHMRIVGRDGMQATNGVDAATFDIMPASRLDVLVSADSPGTLSLVATGVLTSGPAGFSVRRPLGSIVVAGASTTGIVPPPAFPRQPDLRTSHIDARRLIVFSENLALDEFYVNGRKFDPTRTDVHVPLGNVEEWTIRNVTDDFHEFHIHQVSFQVSAVNGVGQIFSGYVDDVDVPSHGEVKLIIPFTDPNIIGHLMFHCHVLNHEDRGMMTMVEVYLPGLLHICKTPDG